MLAPVAYIVFNRPEATARSFAAIRSYRPKKLMIIADGARPGHPTDSETTAKVRSIVQDIDWPCDVVTNFSETNLGCRTRIETGLDWVFEQVESAIIIEDDCVPNDDFWPFCETLLEKYRDQDKVGGITGMNFQDGAHRGDAAYYFSKNLHVWGWATWRRVWKLHDKDMTFWPNWRRSKDWPQAAPDPAERLFWEEAFERVYRREINTWDYPLVATMRRKELLIATPNKNLVANIGFGSDSTHTRTQAEFATFPLGPLTHPTAVIDNPAADQYTFNHHYDGISLRKKLTKRRLRLMKWRIRWMLGLKSK